MAAVGPITSTSANRHGEAPCVDGQSDLEVDVWLDEGVLPEATPSTLVHVEQRRILRRGDLAEAVAAVLEAH